MRIDLTHRGEFAVRAAVAVALADDGRPISARRIAERMDIPAGFLAHVLADLVKAGIVIGTTGRNGGYRLARPAEDVSLLRVVDAVETKAEPPRCVMRGGACGSSGTCAVHRAFESAASAMRRELALTRLADVARDHRAGINGGPAAAPRLADNRVPLGVLARR
ncbi:MAG: Rrf2 family transcriptional regulator [Chloroflexota bacterium]